MSLVSIQEVMTNVGNSTNDFTPALPVLSRPLAAVYTIITCLAVLGNGMVITVMLLRRRVFNSFTNRLILHQSVIDLIAGVAYFVYHLIVRAQIITVSLESTIRDQIVCRSLATDLVPLCFSVTSTYNLVMISLERFMATCHPVRHRNTWSLAKLKFVVGSSWVIAFLYCSHLVFILEAHQGRCRLVDLVTSVKVLEASLVFAIEYVVPVTILMYTYNRILIRLTKKTANQINGPRNVMSKAKRNVLITTLLIGILFVVCWTPSRVLYIYVQVSGRESFELYCSMASLVACNTFVNPVIYCFKYEHFRSELKQLVFKRFQRNRTEIGNAIQMLPIAQE